MIAGTKTRLKESYGLARDGSGNIHVANYGLESVTVYRAGAKGNARPIGVLRGRKTNLYQPVGIAIR
jgi:hypothetical protein